MVEPPEGAETPGLPAVPDSATESASGADYSSDDHEDKVKVETAEPARLAEPGRPAAPEQLGTAEPDKKDEAAAVPNAGDAEHGDRRKRRSRHRTSDSREDARQEREDRTKRRERQQALQRSPSVREPRQKDSRRAHEGGRNRGRRKSRDGNKGSREGSKGRGKGKKGGKKGKEKRDDGSRSSGHSSHATTGSNWPSRSWDGSWDDGWWGWQDWQGSQSYGSQSYDWGGQSYGRVPLSSKPSRTGWYPTDDGRYSYWNGHSWGDCESSPPGRTREVHSMVEDPDESGKRSKGSERPPEPAEGPVKREEESPKRKPRKLPLPRQPMGPPPPPPKQESRTKEEKGPSPPREEPSRRSERRSGDRDRDERREGRGDDRGRRDEGRGNRDADGGRDRRKDEDRSRRGPPREDEKKNPAKKSKAGPPSGGGGDGGDGPDDSSYTYSYEEESGESEQQTPDPSVRGSTAGSARSHRSRRSQPGSARSGGSRHRGGQGSEASTVKTLELQEMLQNAAKKQQPERSKPAISQVKIEPFRGNRDKYRDWKKMLDAQRALYRLDDYEMALLIYISCEGEARHEISEIQGERGLQRVLRLLEDAFGSRADERFEQKQEAYLSYRRTPGTMHRGVHRQPSQVARRVLERRRRYGHFRPCFCTEDAEQSSIDTA